MKVIGIDGGATKVSGGVVERVNPNTFKLVDPTIDIQYADHPDFNPIFSPPPLHQQSETEISNAEKKQGDAMVDCIQEVIQSLADEDDFQVAIAMPGIKTPNGRGISVMANGPRIPDLADQIEKRISSPNAIQRLESDADMCAWGEEYAENGAFRNIINAYYLGGGTGTADGLKLNGGLIPFDEASDWMAKSIELKIPNGKSLETYASMSGINELRNIMTDKEIGTVLGRLIFERISTIHSGWKNQFQVDRDIDHKHPFINSLLDRIVIGQRLSQFFQSEEGKAIFDAVIEGLTLQCSNANDTIAAHFLNHGKFNQDRIILSNLRAAPIIGLGAKAWLNQC